MRAMRLGVGVGGEGGAVVGGACRKGRREGRKRARGLVTRVPGARRSRVVIAIRAKR